RGYAFFHRQDGDYAKKTATLNIAFGSMGNKKDPAAAKAIGASVKKTLEAQGLFVNWGGEVQARLVVYPNEAFLKRDLGGDDIGQKLRRLATLLAKDGFELISEAKREELGLPPSQKLQGDIGYAKASKLYRGQ